MLYKEIGEYELNQILEKHSKWVHQEEGGERANLHGVDLSCTTFNLHGADLRGADLTETNLNEVDLRGADLTGTRFSENEAIRQGIKLSKPLIGWKKCKHNAIVKLEIPKGAIVFSINHSKCRTDRAKVIEIKGAPSAESIFDKHFIYHVGDEIEIFDFDLQYNVECGAGIHFFLTEEEAKNFCEYH